MSPKPEFCKQCPINSVTTGFVPLAHGSTRELIVGEAAGENEAREGRPFIGGSGGWLHTLLKAAGRERSQFNIINTIGCRPPDNCYPLSSEWEQRGRAYFQRILDEQGRALQRGKGDRQLYDWASQALTNYPTNYQAREAVAYCANHHLWPSIAKLEPSRIIAMGNEALEVLTSRSGILVWRGSPLPLKGHEAEGPKVIPTLHPAFLMRVATMFSVVAGDFNKSLTLPPEEYNLEPTLDDLAKFDAKEFAFDFEWNRDQSLRLCGLSDRLYRAIVVPWEPRFVDELRRIFENATDLIGQNIINADTQYFDRLGWKIKARYHDTMLKQHLIQPNYRHGLGFICSVFTNKVFWKGDRGHDWEEDNGSDDKQVRSQWQTYDKPYAIPREFGGYGGCRSAEEAYRLYNARDTDGNYQAEFPIRSVLSKYGMDDVYWNVSTPAAFVARWIGDAGLKIDKTRLVDIRRDLEQLIEQKEQTLPEGLKPYTQEITKQIDAPPNSYKPKVLSCKGSKKAPHKEFSTCFNKPSDSEKWTCPRCGASKKIGKLKEIKRIKVPAVELVRPWNSSPKVMLYAQELELPIKLHMKTGQPTANKAARKSWGKTHPEFLTLNECKKSLTLKNSFAKEGLLSRDRVWFNILIHGTGEGRVSSTGWEKRVDPNIQNQPKSIRKIYVPDYPGYGFLSADFKQGENMLTTWIAKDWDRWERLHTPGYDEHTAMASAFFNIPYDKIDKHKGDCLDGCQCYKRKYGKIINHGKNYLLGEKKCLEQVNEEAEGQLFTAADIHELFMIWEKENHRTALWQREVVALAQAQGFLRNAFGRCIWFTSRDYGPKAVAFLPASTLADITLRCMIAMHHTKLSNVLNYDPCKNLGLTTYGDYLPNWRMSVQVHDSIVSHGPEETMMQTARFKQAVMCQPWRELDGFKLDVDIEWSTKSWGEVKTIEVN